MCVCSPSVILYLLYGHKRFTFTYTACASLSWPFQVIHMLVVIILVFVCCWTPYLAINVAQAFGALEAQLRGVAKHAKLTFTLMAYLNSALNPIIYGFMSRSFRESFYQFVCSCARRRRLKQKRQPLQLRQQRQVSTRSRREDTLMVASVAVPAMGKEQQHEKSPKKL